MDIIATLNNLLVIELTASDVYWQQARILADLGYSKLAEQKSKDADEERGHAEAIINRILLLGGQATFSRSPVEPGTDVAAMLAVGLKLETAARDQYTPTIAEVLAAGDQVTRDLLSENQEANEEGIRWHQRQLRLIEQMSLPNYLQAQL